MAPPFPLLEVAITPADGTKNVWLREPLRVVFSDDIDIAGTWELVDDTGAQRDAIPTLSGNVLTIDVLPLPALASASTNLTLVVHAGWRSVGGAELDEDARSSFVAPAWLPVGAEVPADGETAVALDPEGRAVAAWIRDGAVGIGREDRGAWLPLGGRASFVSAGTESVAIATGALGEIAVAWHDSTIHVWRFADDVWTELPDPLLENDASGPSIAIDSTGRIVLAYVGTPGAEALARVHRWDPALPTIGWVNLGSGSLRSDSSTGSRQADLALSPSDEPYVAFAEKRPNPAEAREIGVCGGEPMTAIGPLQGAPDGETALAPKIAILGGAPVVAWNEHAVAGGAERRVAASRWHDGVWLPLPPMDRLAGATPATGVDIAAGGSHLYAAWIEKEQIVPAALDGASWTPVGAETIGDGVETLAIATDRWGFPVITWFDGDAMRAARLNR